jgi:hypothetical protein
MAANGTILDVFLSFATSGIGIGIDARGAMGASVVSGHVGFHECDTTEDDRNSCFSELRVQQVLVGTPASHYGACPIITVRRSR